MKEYTYSEARQKLSTVLDEAKREGAIRIRRRDGQAFILKSEVKPQSPLDVKGLDLDISPARSTNSFAKAAGKPESQVIPSLASCAASSYLKYLKLVLLL